MSAETTVRIRGLPYRIGATYAPQSGSHRRKTLLRYRQEAVWPFYEPSVQWQNKNGSTEWGSASSWHKWVGQEVDA